MASELVHSSIVCIPNRSKVQTSGEYLRRLLERSPTQVQCARFEVSGWMATTKSQPLAYGTLDVSLKEIRLLRVQANHNGHVQCALERHKLDSLPPYRALSYMWGPEQPLSNINVEDSTFQVRQNLYMFLELYNKRHLSEYIWIDQICINQDDLAERNSQVRLMGNIYSGAREVLIWLNPLQYHRATFRDWKSKLCATRGTCGNCERIFGFGYNDYWGRMWIIQEVLMARKLTVYYGPDVMEWQNVSQLVWANPEQKDWLSSWIHSTFAWMLKVQHDAKFMEHRQASMTELMSHTRKNQCSEARDHLFAVQGLLQSESQVRVNYDLPILEVFLDGAVTMLRESGKRRSIDVCRNIEILGESMLSKELEVSDLYSLEKQYFEDLSSMATNVALTMFRSRLCDKISKYRPSSRTTPSWPGTSFFSSG